MEFVSADDRSTLLIKMWLKLLIIIYFRIYLRIVVQSNPRTLRTSNPWNRLLLSYNLWNTRRFDRFWKLDLCCNINNRNFVVSTRVDRNAELTILRWRRCANFVLRWACFSLWLTWDLHVAQLYMKLYLRKRARPKGQRQSPLAQFPPELLERIITHVRFNMAYHWSRPLIEL